jgi:Zn-dependent M32 family carboxypeptidase
MPKTVKKKKPTLSPELIAMNKAMEKREKMGEAICTQDKEYSRLCNLRKKKAIATKPLPKYTYKVLDTVEKHPHNGPIDGVRVTRILSNADEFLAHLEAYDYMGDGYYGEETDRRKKYIPIAHETSYFVYQSGGVLFESVVTPDDRRRQKHNNYYVRGYSEDSVFFDAPTKCTNKEWEDIRAGKIADKFIKKLK